LACCRKEVGVPLILSVKKRRKCYSNANINEEKSIKMMLSNLQVTLEAEVFDGSHPDVYRNYE